MVIEGKVLEALITLVVIYLLNTLERCCGKDVVRACVVVVCCGGGDWPFVLGGSGLWEDRECAEY